MNAAVKEASGASTDGSGATAVPIVRVGGSSCAALDRDGAWSLPVVPMPAGEGAVFEDLLWFRFEGEDFGRSEAWNGRVTLLGFAGRPEGVAIRCSQSRRDGTLEFHDGKTWRQTGVILRVGVDYVLRSVIDLAHGQADVDLIELPDLSTPQSGGAAPSTATAPTNSSTTKRATTVTVVSTQAARVGPPLLGPPPPGTGRSVRVAAGMPCVGLSGDRFARSVRVQGGPRFDVLVRAWQLWHVSSPAGIPGDATRVKVRLDLDRPVRTTGHLRVVRTESGTSHVSFPAQVGLRDDLSLPATWSGAGRVVDVLEADASGLVVAVRGLRDRGDVILRRFTMPRAPFRLRIGFKLPADAPGLRETDLVRFVDPHSDATVGPYVRLLSGMQAAKPRGYAGRLAVIEMQPQPVVDGHPIQPGVWHELLLTVDPIRGQFTATGAVHGETRPTLDAPLPGEKPDGNPVPKWTPLFGGGARKFFAMPDPPCEVALQLGSDGAYRSAVTPVELSIGPSIVLPKHDAQRPWTNPRLLTDMTWRDGRLEILSGHEGGSLMRVDPGSGELAFVRQAFGPDHGQAMAWDASRSCYWWVQPKSPHHLQARRGAGAEPPKSTLVTMTASAPSAKEGEPPQPIAMRPHGRLTATAKDVFYATWAGRLFRWRDKRGTVVAFNYHEAFDKKIQYAGVAADGRLLLLGGHVGAPNAADVMAIDLASGKPIRRFSLRHAAGGITAMARGEGRLYVLSANDRLILDCPWPDEDLLGLTQPVMHACGVTAVPVFANETLSLLPPDRASGRAWSGAVKAQQTQGRNGTTYALGSASLSLPEPALVVGDTLGEYRILELRFAKPPQSGVLHLSLCPSPVGKSRDVYLVGMASTAIKNATQPGTPIRTNAKTFFATDAFVSDTKSPLRKHKPEQEDAPVFILPAHVGTTLSLDMVTDLGLRPGTWISQIRTTTIGEPFAVGGVIVGAAADVVAGSMTGGMLGGVLDLGPGTHRLIATEVDISPGGRSGDTMRLGLRTAAHRTALPYAVWRDATRSFTSTQTSRPATTFSASGPAEHAVALERFVQWRVGLVSPHRCEPPTLSSIKLVVARHLAVSQAAPESRPYQAWRTWWPAIFAAPVACVLVWFAFLRRGKDEDAQTRRVR